MTFFEIFILGVLILGFGYLILMILRDPFYFLKSFLRGLKADGNWRLKIIFFPLWGPIWVFDKIFKLKLYINEFEEASVSKKISFKEYDKYLLIKLMEIDNVENAIKSFLNEIDPKGYNNTLNESRIKIAEYKNEIVVKMEKMVVFSTLNALIEHLNFSYPQDKNNKVKGVFINSKDRDNSFFVFSDMGFPYRLIGKTYRNKKIYVELYSDSGIETNETIYMNSNMDYFKNFHFDRFENEISRMKFKEIVISPAHNNGS